MAWLERGGCDGPTQSVFFSARACACMRRSTPPRTLLAAGATVRVHVVHETKKRTLNQCKIYLFLSCSNPEARERTITLLLIVVQRPSSWNFRIPAVRRAVASAANLSCDRIAYAAPAQSSKQLSAAGSGDRASAWVSTRPGSMHN